MVWLLKCIAWWMARLPLPLVLFKGRCWGALFGWVAVRHRRRADLHLSQVLPDIPRRERQAIRRRMFRHLGMNVVEMLRWMGGAERELQRRISVEGREHLEAALAMGKGVIGMTAHLGNWDLLGLWMAGQCPVTIISKELRNPGLNRYWMARRAAAGIEIVPAHHSYRSCLAALRNGRLLGFILDQNMIRTEGIFVNFFGRPACTTPGMAMLAAHAQAPILPIYMIRELDGNHRVRILPPIPPPADRIPETIASMTQRCTAMIEEWVRGYPDQWIWMHRRWRTQPAPAQKG